MRPSTARNGPVGDSEYILYDANAGYQQTLLPVVTRPAKKTGLGSHRHHQHHRTGGSEPLERHETPNPARSDAVKARFQCVRVRAQARVHSRACPGQFAPAPASPRLLRSARRRPLRPLTRLLPRPNRRRARRNTRQRSGKTPQTAKKPGLGAGPGHPEPRRERRDTLGPSVTIMPVDSYSTLGRSCEPAFKWIPDPGQARIRARIRARAARQRQTLAGGWSALGGHEVSCSFTWPGSSPEVQPARSRA